MSTVLIGWAEVDTTPEERVDLCGQYYHRLSEGIHSRLSATALAMESTDGAGQAVMISVDLVGFSARFLEELCESLRFAIPGLDPTNIVLNATHTHSAPCVDPIAAISWLSELPNAMPILDYRKFLLGKLKTVVLEAWGNRKPGGIAAAMSFARVGHCRRTVYANDTAEMYGRTDREDFIGMEGGEDSGIDLLFTFDGNCAPTGVILNLPCPSQVMEATYKISSDFMGEARRLLKQRFGPEFRILGQISAAGCQSPRDLTRNDKGEPDFWREDGVKEIGERLVAGVERAFPQAAGRIDFSPKMGHAVREIRLPRRRVSYHDYVQAEKQVRELEAVIPENEAYRRFCEEVGRNEKIPGRPGPYDSKLHHFVLIQNNKAVLARWRDQDEHPTYEMELHVIRIGDAVLVTNPFELYLDFGHQMKTRSPAEQTFVVQLCCGTGGYLPSARAEELGGYGGLVINGEVGSDGGEMLVDKTLQEIGILWK